MSAFVSTAQAQTWTGATSTAWGTATNWDTNTVPAAAGIVIIDNAGLANQPTLDVASNALTATNISAGTLALDNILTSTTVTLSGTGNLKINASGSVVGAIELNGGGLQANGALSLSNTVNVTAAGSAIDVTGANAMTLTGTLAGTNSFTKNGTGTLNFGAGLNTAGFSGGMTLAAGTLSIQTDLAGTFGTIVTTGSVIDYANGATSAAPININSNTTQLQTLLGVTAVQQGVISETAGPRPLEKIGDGTLIFTGANTYTGVTTITGGTLQIGNGGTAGTLGTGNVTNNATLAFNRTDAVTVGTIISGTGVVIQNGSGSLVLNGANTYSGGTSLNFGTIQVGNNTALGTGALNMANGTTLQSGAAGLSLANNIALGGANQTVDTQANTFTLGGIISGGAGNQLTKIGTGTLIFTGANTYTGVTTITGGTLQIGNGGTAGTLGTGNVTNNATLAFNRTDAVTVGSIISGTGVVAQNGSGSLVLNGANTYSGGTSLNFGTIQVGNNTALGTGPLNMANGTTLQSGAAGLSLANNIALGGANQTVDTQANTFTLGGIISGGAGNQLTKIGTGTLVLTGANTYTGQTNVNAGTLNLQGATAAMPGTVMVAAAGNFNNNGGTVTGLVTNAGASSSNSGTLNGGLSNSGGFANSGTINGGAGNGGTLANTGTINGGLTNTGTVNANAGQVNGLISNNAGAFNVGGTVTSDNNFNNAAGATLSVNTGPYTIAGILANLGLVTIAANQTLNSATINNNGGTIAVGAGATLHGTANTLNNAAAINVATGGNVTDAGNINNLATGVINFNGPGGTATLSSGTNVIANDGQINVNSGGVNVSGNVTNQGAGLFNLAAGAGTVALTGNLTNQNTATVTVNGGVLNISGTLANTSTTAPGVVIVAGTTVTANNVSNALGSTINNAGTLGSTNPISNAGTLNTNVATSIINGGITNTGTVNAAGQMNGAVINNSSGAFNLAGNLVGNNSNFTNNNTATLNVGAFGYTGLNTLSNTSTSTSAVTVTGGSITASTAINNTAGTFTNTGGTMTAPTVSNTGTGILNTTGTIAASTSLTNAATMNAQGTINTPSVVNSGAFTTTGALTGNGSFGNTGTLNVTGGNYTGLTTVTNSSALNLGAGRVLGATTTNNNAGGTITAGAGSNLASNLNNNASATYTTSGSTTITGNVANAGAINLMGSGPSGATVVTGNYAGTGTLLVNVNAATGTANSLAIGGSVAGSTNVLFNVQANGFIANPITIASAAGSGPPAGFVGGIPSFGLVTYNFAQQGNNWVLRSNLDIGTGASVLTSLAGSISSITAGFHQPISTFVNAKETTETNKVQMSVWARGDVGRFNTTSPSTVTYLGQQIASANNGQQITFDGGQVGSDLSVSNINGTVWRAHVGLTAGQINGSVRQTNGSGTTNLTLPFIGAYGVLTNGALTIDALYRREFDKLELNNIAAGLFKRDVDGSGHAISANAYYRATFGNLIVTPGAGVYWSKTSIDDFDINNNVGIVSAGTHVGTLARAGGRVGYNFNLGTSAFVQPFVEIYAWRNFDPESDVRFIGTATAGAPVVNISSKSPSAFTQYAVGFAAGTLPLGFSGFVRGAWQDGDRITGGTISAGGRINF